MKTGSEARRRWAGTAAWALLVLASMALIGAGLWRTLFFVWATEPALVERADAGGLYVNAGCVLSVIATVWSHVRGNPVWVTVCVGLPGILVGWAAWTDPFSLMRHLAAVAEVVRARAYRQR